MPCPLTGGVIHCRPGRYLSLFVIYSQIKADRKQRAFPGSASLVNEVEDRPILHFQFFRESLGGNATFSHHRFCCNSHRISMVYIG